MERREFLKYVGIAGVAIALPPKIFGVDSIKDFFWQSGIELAELPITEVQRAGGLIEKYRLRAESMTGKLHRYAWPIENPTPTSYAWYVDLSRDIPISYGPGNRFCGFYQSEEELKHFLPQIIDDIKNRRASKGMYDKWAIDSTWRG